MIAARHVGIVLFFAVSAGCGQIVGIKDLSSDEIPDAGALPPRDAGSDPIVDAGRDVIVPVEDATPGPTFKRVFVTSDRSNGIMGGMAGADGRCAAAAVRGSLPGTWVPWLSGEGINAIDRITFDGEYRLLDGRTVAKNKAQLASGNLTNPIDVIETGAKYSGEVLVWTGTARDGKLFAVCSNWTTNNVVDFGTVGSLDRAQDGLWTDNLGPGAGFRNWGCQTSGRLYCFER